jgi:methyl-accepting chemotaxis protein
LIDGIVAASGTESIEDRSKMKLREIARLNTISKTFLILTLILSAGLGTVLVKKSRATFEFLMEMKGTAMADFLGRVGIKSVMNKDLSALEGYVKETLKDSDVAFVAFYDAEKKQLTQTSREPKDTTSLFIQEREIRNGGDGILGYLKMGYSRSAVSGNRFSDLQMVIVTTLIVLTLLSLGGVAVVRNTALPLGHLVEVIEKVAEGDLTAEVKPDVDPQGDEAGILARAFAKMSTRLKGVIKTVQDASHQITFIMEQAVAGAKRIGESTIHQADEAARTSSSVDEMNSSMNKISKNIGVLSSAAQDTSYSLAEMSAAIRQAADSTGALSTSVEETASSLSLMSGTIKEVAGHIDTLLLYAEEATTSVTQMNTSIEGVEKNAKESALLAEKVSQEAAELGIGAIKQTIDGMEQIKKTVEKSAYIIHKLDERAKKIGNILTVIDGVTRQTNMLALNASILAAQAGNEGKGFSVVSEEMKNLADRTEASTTEIAQLIRDVQSDTTDAVGSVKEGLRSVEEGVRRSSHAKESLNQIMETSKQSSVMSRQIEKATLEQVNATNQMTQLMEKVSVMVMKINTAMTDLENGTFKITQASGKMNSITQQVQTYLEEQAKGSIQINDAGNRVRVQIQQIATAIDQQKKGIEILTNSILEIQQMTQVNVQTAQQVNQAMEGLTGQTNLLKKEVHHFKIKNV